jgi:hypothetical protein
MITYDASKKYYARKMGYFTQGRVGNSQGRV